MRVFKLVSAAAVSLALANTSAANVAVAQTGPSSQASPATATQEPAPGQTQPNDAVQAPPAKKTYTVPAGTKILLQLRSGINTRSAKAGDGVYLASTFPVVVANRVMIPSGVYVQGVVDRVVRAGHVKGTARHALYVNHLSQWHRRRGSRPCRQSARSKKAIRKR